MSRLPLIEAGPAGLLDALDRAARMRRNGTRFEVAFDFPNDRGTVANLAACDIAAKLADIALRKAAFDRLAAHDARLGTAVLENLSTLAVPERKTAYELWKLADAVRITSFAQYRRLMIGLDYAGRRRLVEPADPSVPIPEGEASHAGNAAGDAGSGERVVVWARAMRTEAFVLVLAAACADGAPVDVVCAGGDTFGHEVTFVPPGREAAALARSGVTIACGDHPGTAMALAAWKRPVCAATTAGAHQWLRGVTPYRPWSRLDLERAIAIARAKPASFDRVLPMVEEPPPSAEETRAESVRIIVRARSDAPSSETAAALAALRHRRFTVVTVAPDAAVRPLVHDTAAAFAIVFDDGDAPYPEALSRLIASLEMAGDDAVTCDFVATYVDDAKPPRVIGYATLANAAGERTTDGVPLRTLIRSSKNGTAGVPRLPAVRVDAVLGTVHRMIDGRSAFMPGGAIVPERRPALRFDPARPL